MHDASACWRRLPCPAVRVFNNLVKALLMSTHRSALLRPFLLAAAALFSLSGFAQSGPLIVTHPQVIEAQKRGAVIWDIRSEADYKKGHIPGAVNIGDAGQVLRSPTTEDFIATPQIERILGAAGIDPAKEVLVYGSRANVISYFGLYTIRYFGGDNVRVYHDGIDGWRAAGQPIALESTRPTAIALKLNVRGANSVSTPEILAGLKNPNIQLLDVRTPKEFAGEDIRAIRGGHIPGAINIPYEQNWIDPETQMKLGQSKVADNAGMSLKPLADLKALYARMDPDKETIVYCQSGVRAAETATVLADLGFKNVKVYDSSWLGYGNTLDAPADNAVFLNVGALNSRIGSLQNRLDVLEKELASRSK
jgi:thiosulfate/3-mercaptopyruvate sulfurtransferase